MYLKVFLVGTVTLATKIAIETYYIDSDPDILQQYALAKNH